MSAGAAPSTVSVERLDARVTALELQGSKIIEKLDALSVRLDGSGRPQWAVIIAGLGFMLAVLGFVGTSWKAPIETTVLRQDADIRALQGQIVPRAEHSDKWKAVDANLDILRERFAKDLAETNRRIERLEERTLYKPGQGKDGGRG